MQIYLRYYAWTYQRSIQEKMLGEKTTLHPIQNQQKEPFYLD